MGDQAITLRKQPESGSGAGIPDFDELFDAHHRQVFQTAYRVTGNLQDAEDVAQSVFLRLLQRNGCEGHRNPSGYLYRAAINAGIDLLRSRSRERTESLVEADHADDDSTADTDARQAELRHLLRRALLELEPRAAEMFSLRYFEEFSNTEIAAIMETTPNTVTVTLHRARTRLQEILGELEGEYR